MKSMQAIAKSFLRYSFSDINFEYERLTNTEKTLCSPEEFKKLVEWIKKWSKKDEKEKVK